MNNITSFKVGDIVEAINNDYVYTNLANNWCGEIVGFKYNQVQIRTASSRSNTDSPGGEWYVRAEDFHLNFAHSKSNNFKTIYNILNGDCL
jgi:hypothetical protein